MFDAEGAIGAVDQAHEAVCAAQRRMFSLIAQADARESWEDWGARDLAHLLSIRLDISVWKAQRWVEAAGALESLPRLSRAFEEGKLGIDKVVELTRFATPECEARLIRWARGVSAAGIRRRADAARVEAHDAVEAHQDRSLRWWYAAEGSRFGIQGELPAAQGAVVARALDRMAKKIPLMPGEEGGRTDARRADALVGLCSARIGADPDPDRATVVIHAQLGEIVPERGGCEIEGATAIHPATVRRLLCEARTQIVVEDEAADVVALGPMGREPSAWMARQVRYRDGGCRFPGCGTRAFTQAHHLVFWSRGGPTTLENLLLVCSFHHRLVHELGWSVRREAGGHLRWLRPDGTRYRAGPEPLVEPLAESPELLPEPLARSPALALA